mgnify:CR=1 FL=1
MSTPKILYNAKDSPHLNSGYGIMTRYLTPLLAKRYGAKNVNIMAPVYQKDHILKYRGMNVLPGTGFDFGENIILEHYNATGSNILLQVGDATPLGALPDLAAKNQVLWVQWMPVDFLGTPKNIVNRIQFAYKIIPFTKQGEAMLRQAGFGNVDKAIWLGLNTKLWRPQERKDLPKVMQSLNFREDTFNLLIVGANQERKRLRQQLEGIALFRAAVKQANPRLYIHTTISAGERDIAADLDELGLADITTYPTQYSMVTGGFGEDKMVAIFNCADVCLNVCMEGFGYSMLQAQSVGVPVIYLTAGAGPEIVVNGAGVSPLNAETLRNQMASAIPDVQQIAEALEVMWRKRMDAGKPLRSEKAIQFVQDNFAWESIAGQWFDTIDRIMVDQERYCYQVPPSSDDLELRARTIVEVN